MPQINRPAFQPGPQQLALMQVLQGLFQQPTNPTPWGFHEPGVTAGAGVEAGLQGAGQILDDPRNAWMGLGPLGALGTMARFRRVPDLGRDAGGFHVPIKEMRREMGIPTPNRRLDEIPGGTERAVRDDYLGSVLGSNNVASAMTHGPFGENASNYLRAHDAYIDGSPLYKELISKTLLGRQALEQDLIRASQGLTGGSEPNALQLRRFGFGR